VDDVASSGPEFFDIRYTEEKMPWDFGGIPDLLNKFLAERSETGRVLIPGCGSAYEIEAFSERGWEAMGLDFSAAGVARARQLLGPLGSKVHYGDFFDYPLGGRRFDAVYERAFLCSLPPEFFFMGPEDDPPPYPISQDELFKLLGGFFAKLRDQEVEDSLPLYAGKERWQIWTRK
jgi:SAM-dependent methyltransferase